MRLLSFVLLGLLPLQLLGQDVSKPFDPVNDFKEGDIYLDFGRKPVMDKMGYGWGDNSHHRGWSGRWITHHEADLVFELKTIADYAITLRASPALKMDKLQPIGLFINNHFVEQWLCPFEVNTKVFKGVVPAERLVLGENKLTLRIGYTTVPGGGEQRRLGLNVDYIHLRPADAETD